MNFMLQLNAFYDWLQANSISSNAQLLYYTLLQVNNKCGWISWFQRTNMSLCGLMGISENTLKAARNELKVKGLIDFRSGNKKNDPTKYHMIELYTDKRVSKFDTQLDTKADTNLDTITDTQADDIYKLKQKEIVEVVDGVGEDYDQGLKKIQQVFSNNIHLITPFEYQKMQDWLKDMEADLIVFAIEEAVLQGGKSMAYIEGILRSYKRDGIRTRVKAEDLKREWLDRKTQKEKVTGAQKGNKVWPAAKGNGFHNFEPRQYNSGDLEAQLLKKSSGELISDEEFERFMADRRTKNETNRGSGYEAN